MGIYFLCVYINKKAQLKYPFLISHFQVPIWIHHFPPQNCSTSWVPYLMSSPPIHLFTQFRNPYRFSSSSLNPSVQSVTKLLISLQQHLSDLSPIPHYLSQISLFLLELRNGVFPAITVNKDWAMREVQPCHIHQQFWPSTCKFLSPKGTQED